MLLVLLPLLILHSHQTFNDVINLLNLLPPRKWHHPDRTHSHWERGFKLPWRETGPPNSFDDEVDSDQQVVSTKLCLSVLTNNSVLSFAGGIEGGWSREVRPDPTLYPTLTSVYRVCATTDLSENS